MRKFILILGIYFAFNLIWSILFDNSSTGKILWIETNIWILRLFWAIIATKFFYEYLKQKNVSKK